MKKYLIPGIPLCETMTGIPRYMFEILTRVDSLLEDCTDVKLTICYPLDMKIVNYKFKNIEVVALDRTGKKWLPQVVKPYLKETNSILCDMADGFSFCKGQIVKIDDVRPAVMKFDPLAARIKFRIMLLSARLNASVVITVSESQRKQLLRFMPKKRIEIFPNSCDHLKNITPSEEIFKNNPGIKKGQYYYSLGSIAKHKNFQWIYEVARRNPNKQFVIAGNQDLKKWGTDTGSVQLTNVFYVGYVTDSENRALYENCRAFIHPSFYEGFGIPPLEAVSFGKDILVSNIPEFIEVYGDKVSYLDPNEYDIDLDQIKHLNDNDRNEILSRFSWDETAKMWMKLFKEL